MSTPTTTATARAPHTGSTAPGLAINKFAITTANTAFTSRSKKNIMSKNSTRARPPTIYRTLDFLLEQGFIHRIESLNAFIGCDHPKRRHEYQLLICESCGVVRELHLPELSGELYASAEAAGFRPSRQTMEVSGLCRDCQARDAD